MLLGPEEILDRYYQDGKQWINTKNVDVVYQLAAEQGRIMIMKDIESNHDLDVQLQFNAINKILPIAPFPISLEYVCAPPRGFTPTMQTVLQKTLDTAYSSEREAVADHVPKKSC
ncbi:MAG: hypothetical protein AB7I18_06325 [Candidatus Berkiella sp.]